MKTIAVLLVAACAVAAVPPQRSSAFTPILNHTQIAAAMLSGETLFRDGRGYQAPRYVLFAERNTLHIRKGEGPVEAILVGTPYERLSYATYLATFEGKRVALPWGQAMARRNENVIQFIVFSHGNTAQDRQFLQRVSNGRLQLGPYVLAPTDAPAIFGPAMDYYQIDGAARQFRWLGSVTFRFDLSRVHASGTYLDSASGTFSFTASDGSRRRYHVDLARYL